MNKNEMISPVTVANNLIESRYKYTSLEVDLMCRIIQAVNGSQYTQINFRVSQLCDHMGESNSNIDYLRKAFKGLLSKPIELFNDGTYTIANVISGVKIDSKAGRVFINVDPFMLPFLIQLKNCFTSFELPAILAMSSAHAKRIYMMCCQFRNTGIFQITVDELKKRLLLQDKYKRFSDFDDRVIKTSIAEINQHSEINVMLSSKERGTYAIENLYFHITTKHQFNEVTGEEKQVKFMFKCKLADWQVKNACAQKMPGELAPILRRLSLRINDKAQPAINDLGAFSARFLQNEGIEMRKPLPRQMVIPA